MFTLEHNQAYCEAEERHPDSIVRHGGFCIGFTRRSWGIGSLGGSALEAYRHVPHAEVHVTSPSQVPKGAICYGLHGEHGQRRTTYGHAWISSGGGKCYTTDYGGMGKIAEAPVNLPRWTGVHTVTWTTWTPYGHIPVLTKVPVGHPAAHHAAPTIRLSSLRYGQSNHDVRDLQLALNRHLGGSNVTVDGHYTAHTDALVRKCQHLHGFGSDAPHHSSVGPRQAAHLGLRVI